MGKNLVGECFLAVIGVDALLDPGPLRVTAEQRDRAIDYPKEIRAELKAFLSSDVPDRGEPLPAFDYRKVLKQLNDFPTDPVQQQAHVADKLAGFKVAPDAGVAFLHAAGAAVKYLQAVIPRRQRTTSTGPVLIEPNAQELSRFRRSHATVQDPMSLFADLGECCLSKDQVKCFETVYPALAEDSRTSAQTLLSQIAAERATSWTLPSAKDRMLKRFMGVDDTDPQMTRALQESFKPGADKTQTAGGGQLTVSPDVQGQTPTQRIAAK